ncbi:ABC transporter permease [soil metagenome]
MKASDFIRETYSALVSNKIRTSLTMLGIVIGIASVIAMVSIGQGAQASIQSSIQSLGSNLILISPGSQGGAGTQVSAGRGSARTLIQADADAISTGMGSVNAVSAELTGRYQVTAKGTNTNTSVIGVTSAYPTVRNLEIAEGDFISDQNVRSLSKVAVLGPTARDDLFGVDADAIGQTIRIKGQQFKVIGITVAKGGSGFTSQDDMIFVPLTTEQKLLAGEDYVTTIAVQAASADAMAQVQADITALLLTRHKISNPAAADFNILNQNDIVATASSITGTFTILLAAVAGISLLVGGIGIMNMMLTTVTERTREIGLRKAIGAKQADISRQFLFEAVALTLTGGLLGVMLGMLISFGVNALGLISTSVSLSSILLAFGVSTAIGVVFGYYPATRAAKLNPIDALRYE